MDGLSNMWMKMDLTFFVRYLSESFVYCSIYVYVLVFLAIVCFFFSNVLPFSAPRNGPDANSVKSGEVKYRHFVFRLDFADWEVGNFYISACLDMNDFSFS